MPRALDHVRRLDALAHERAARFAHKIASIPEPRLVRVLCLLVGLSFAQPTAAALFYHHARPATGYLLGIAGLASLALLSWLRERGN